MNVDNLERGGSIDLSDPRHWDTALFPVAVGAQAALVPVATYRQWIVRERVQLWNPPEGHALGVPAESEGKSAFLTFRGVLYMAAAARLAAKGVEVAEAFTAAMRWAHRGEMDRPGHWVGETDVPKLAREPAGLFPGPDWTLLIHHKGDDARVVKARPHADGTLPIKISDLFAVGGPTFTPPTIVLLNKVHGYARQVCEGFLRP